MKRKLAKPGAYRPKLFVASFAYGGGVPVQFMNSVISMIRDLNDNGIDVSCDIRPGGPYLVKERNICVQRFMETDCTHMLFIDADLAFDPSAARRMILKNMPLMGGLYRYKMEREAYPAQLYVREDNGDYFEKDGLYKAAGLPTGFMMIRRDVIQQMQEAYPESKYQVRDSYSGETIMELYDLFDCLLYDGQWWGEDYVFCRRWTALGGYCWVFPDIDFAHIGSHSFIGNWNKFYQAEKPQLMAEHQEMMQKEAVNG